MLSPINRTMWRVNKFVWLSLVAVLLWLLLRLPSASRATQSAMLWVFSAAIANVSARTWIAYRSGRGTAGPVWGWAFTVADIILISVAVHVTGRLQSDLWLLYFLLVITETLNVTVKEERLLLGLTFLGYGMGAWPFTDGVSFGTRLFAMYVVGAIARRLHLNDQERSHQLALVREQLGVAEEKSRIARELHDGLGRELVNVILGLEVVRRTATKRPEQVTPLLEENIVLLREAMNETRDLVAQTRAWTMDTEDCRELSETIERYARQFSARTEIAVQVRSEWETDALPPPFAFGILRIVQETLNNVAKHAQASEVDITFYQTDHKKLTVTMTDNGIGFTPAQKTSATGMGLHAMQERAAALSGTLQTVSAPGHGTTVTLTVPLP